MGPPQKHDSATFRHNADKSYPDAATKIAIVPSLFACKVRVDVRSPSNIRCRFIHERGLFFFSCLRILDSSLGDDGKNIFVTKSNRKSLDEAGDFHKMRSIVLFATDSDFQQCGTDTKTQESPCL